jgi:hypothetical protein
MAVQWINNQTHRQFREIDDIFMELRINFLKFKLQHPTCPDKRTMEKDLAALQFRHAADKQDKVAEQNFANQFMSDIKQDLFKERCVAELLVLDFLKTMMISYRQE